MSEPTPSSEDIKTYTTFVTRACALLAEKVSVKTKTEELLLKKAGGKPIDLSKIDFTQREHIAGKYQPQTFLCTLVNAYCFKTANKAIELLNERGVSNAYLLAALNPENCRGALRNALFYRERLPQSQRDEASTFIDKFRYRLPRKDFITQIECAQYTYDMQQEDEEDEREQEALERRLKLEQQTKETPVSTPPVKPTTTAEAVSQQKPLIQGDFLDTLMNHR